MHCVYVVQCMIMIVIVLRIDIRHFPLVDGKKVHMLARFLQLSYTENMFVGFESSRHKDASTAQEDSFCVQLLV